ncbi:MAG: PKD domain-containing protein, partial [Flavobacteriales bacterium]|nr:PKD domain-containing protein [Flavobacteriales bacterium]
LGVQFFDESSIPAPYNLTGWDWYLGTDSSSASVPNPYLIYNPELDPMDVATYDIRLHMTSANGCTSEIMRPNYITVHPKPIALFSVHEDVMTILKPTFEFTDLSTENVTIWDWDFGDGTYGNEQNPEHTYPDIGTYPITLMVETEFGCRDTIGYEVKVDPVFTFYVPSSFTPDDNGINDEFFGIGDGYTFYSMFIYDRWGELIFESEDDEYHWDGSFKGEQVQMGTYVYRFYLLDWQGHDHEYRGHVTLQR